ncbi:MAG: phosphoenolpyruvate--protein phosphotransferase [Treponema sp.]|jgi:phosphotransferase system enzyme I (PtsI)|nr:phosphoenolpyruvate--protein phosphotransferase [Treponema sp.]
MKILSGISASPGIVIGKALLFLEDNPEIPRYSITEETAEGELRRFVEAVQGAAAELRLLKENARGISREQEDIFGAHLLMVEDPDFHYQIKARFESKYENIEWIVWEISRELSQKLVMSPNAYLRERAADVSDVSRRIIGRLLGIKRFSLAELSEDAILVVRSLLPSDILAMNKSRVKALAMDTGSRTSHAAILLRSFGIPAVLGLSIATREISAGDILVVDGEEGNVIIDPDGETRKNCEEAAERNKKIAVKLHSLKKLPAETLDGRKLVLNANLDMPEEADGASLYGAEGIGLFRSEFLFMTPGQSAEENQFLAYSKVLKAMGKKPVTIRTVDIGGDKIVPGFQGRDEANPLLGWRAIRLSLSLPEMFKTQLRAILRSSLEGNVKIMFPLISCIEELEDALRLLEEAKAECRKSGQGFSDHIEVGTMIEIPAAVMTADILAEKSDFFSIGTNDLIQYSLAVDRGNEKVNYLAQPTHPAVLRFLKQAIDAAHKKGIQAAMCGELAGDPSVTPLLIGLGLDEFSMAMPSIPPVKHIIRRVRFSGCQELAAEALACTSCGQVNELLRVWAKDHIKEDRVKE